MKIIFVLLFITSVLFSQEIIPKDLVVDISKLEAGKVYYEKWNNMPVLLYKRTKNDINALEKSEGFNWENLFFDKKKEKSLSAMKSAGRLASNRVNYYMMDQPSLDLTTYRSKRKELFVCIGLGTVQGFVIYNQLKKVGNRNYFYTADGKEYYDMAGRFSMEASGTSREAYDLYIPPYKFDGDKLIVGIESRMDEYKQYDFDDTDYPSISLDEQLYYGAYNCKLDIVEHALKEGADVDKAVEYGLRPINAALLTKCYGDLEKQLLLVDKILQHKPDLNVCSETRHSPLELSVFTDVAVIKRLVDAGADPKFRCQKAAEGFEYDFVKHDKAKLAYLKSIGFYR